MISVNILKEELKRDEGFRSYAYQDTLGYWTIGYGRLIDKKNGGITEFEADTLLSNDIENTIRRLDEKIPWWATMTDDRQRAIVNMAFNMGINGLLKFKHMLEALRNKNYKRAAEEARNSLWYKQVGKRAERICAILENGESPNVVNIPKEKINGNH